MGETSSALTVSAKLFAAYLPPGSHGESFWLTATCLRLPTPSAKQMAGLFLSFIM